MSLLEQVPPRVRVTAGAVPEWDLKDLVYRRCPLCAHEDSRLVCLRPDRLAVHACEQCGMHFVKAVPSEQQLTKFYQRYAFYKGYAEREEVRPLSLRWRDMVYHCSQNLYIETLEQTGGLRDKTLLDMGCSTGTFMQLARFKGAKASGFELDGAARRAAQSIGFEVAERAPEGGARFDIITAFHVLEHLPEPGSWVKDMVRLLKPEGRAVIAVPNATEVRDFGESWIGFRVDLEHLNYFDLKSLSRLLETHGLYVEHAWQHRQPSLLRTDTPPASLDRSLASRAARLLERAYRILSPPVERFLDGSFNLSVLARRL